MERVIEWTLLWNGLEYKIIKPMDEGYVYMHSTCCLWCSCRTYKMYPNAWPVREKIDKVRSRF